MAKRTDFLIRKLNPFRSPHVPLAMLTYFLVGCGVSLVDVSPSAPIWPGPTVTTGRWFNSLSQTPVVRWTAVSGAQSYEYSLGSAANLMDIAPWTSTGLTQSVQPSGNTFIDGVTYFVNVRAVKTSESSAIRSASWTVKTLPTEVFQNPSSTTPGLNPSGEYQPKFAALIDLDGDGILDLIGGRVGFATFKGNGDGTFQAAIEAFTSAPAEMQEYGAADFNHDGIMDIAVSYYNNGPPSTIEVFFGNGTGGFSSQLSVTMSGQSQTTMTTADLNGDGYSDLISVDFTGGLACVSLNNQNSTFAPAVCYGVGAGPKKILAADVNGDGIQDLITSNSNSTTVSVLLGNGDGTFQAAINSPIGNNLYGMASGDFNHDGFVDFAVANFNAATVSVILGNGSGGFAAPVAYSVGAAGTTPIPFRQLI